MATPAEQNAALAATDAYRSVMTKAGEILAAALGSLQSDTGGTLSAGIELAAAKHAYDVVRVQLAAGPGGLISSTASEQSISDSSLAHLSALLAAGSPISSALAPLVTESVPLQVLLERVILTPSDIALRAERVVAWISSSTPAALSDTSGITRDDLVATAASARATAQAVDGLGRIIAPATATLAEGRLARLEADLADPTTDSRRVVSAADAAVASLGQLAGQLAGYGQGGAYQ